MNGNLTLPQAARLLNVHWRTVAKWVHSGHLVATGEKITDTITPGELTRFANEHGLSIPALEDPGSSENSV